MNPETWQRIKPLFAKAQTLAPENWEDFLDTHCTDDETLRRELRALLEGDREAPTEFLDRAPREALPAGRRIGPYELLHRLGEGGMGDVYLARRPGEDFHKRVALKMLKPGMASADLLRRFRTERQILGALRHPAIAGLLDGGTTEDGLPYFVMEYVEGQPVDRYCDARRLTVSQRLGLFCQVCDAVHVAHQNLVVHRDLKPGNILVTADGAPKLLDFGIAKLLNPELSSTAPAATVAGRPLTPDYASPEQMRGEAVTTASDVYSLGVLLYQLLSGRLPYHASGRASGEMERVICETEPERMSAAVLRSEELRGPDGATTTVTPESVSRTREGEPARLARRLAGDLDNIVAMALRKEPQRRYASVEQLAADLRRHLEGLPVLAAKDTVAYRCGKFIRRHRIGVAASAALILVVLGFGVAMGVQRVEILRQKETAEAERRRAEQVSALLVDLFEVSDPWKPSGESLSAREVLENAERRLQTGLSDQPEVRLALLETIGRIYKNLGLLNRAGPLLETILEDRRRLLGEEHVDVAESLHYLAELRTMEADYTAADALFLEALKMRRKLLGDDHPDVAATLDARGLLLQARGDYEEAEALHREALAIRRRHEAEDPPAIAESLQNLATALYERREFEEAEPLYHQALTLRRKALGEQHPQVARILNDLAAISFHRDDYAAAEALFRESLALRRRSLGEHPDVAESLHNLAFVRHRLGDPEEAEQLFGQALAMKRKFLGEQHPEVAATLMSLARLHVDRGDFDHAEAPAREALGILQGTLPEGDWRIAMVESTLGRCLSGMGRYQEAEGVLLDGYEILRQKKGPSARETQVVLRRVADLYDAWGRADKAAEYRALLSEAPPGKPD